MAGASTEQGLEGPVQLVVARPRSRAALVEGGDAVTVRETETHGLLTGFGQRDRVAAGGREPLSVRSAHPQDAELARRAGGDDRPRGWEPVRADRPFGERHLQGLRRDADGQEDREDGSTELASPERLAPQASREGREPVGDERALRDRRRREPRGRIGEGDREVPGDRGPREDGSGDGHEQRSPRTPSLRVPGSGETDDRRQRQECRDGPGPGPAPRRQPEQEPDVRRADR